MHKNQSLLNLFERIVTYRDGLPKKNNFLKFGKDQTENRRKQCNVMLREIDSAIKHGQLGTSPSDAQKEEIEKLISEIADQAKGSGSKRILPLAKEALEELKKSYQIAAVPIIKNYKKIQCIGFYADVSANMANINIHPRMGHVSSDASNKVYSGDSDDLVDIDRKLHRFKTAIDGAKANIDNDPNTLKVMMGPEFYFRGAKGAYSIDSTSKILEKARVFVGDEEYSDWLFIFGTAITSIALGKNESEIINIALIQQGGFSRSDGQHDLLVYKEYVSSVDFLSANEKHSEFYGTRLAALDGSVKKLESPQGSTQQNDAGNYGGFRDLCQFIYDLPKSSYGLNPQPQTEICEVINEWLAKNNNRGNKVRFSSISPNNIRTSYDSLQKAVINADKTNNNNIAWNVLSFSADISQRLAYKQLDGLDATGFSKFDITKKYWKYDEEAGGLAGGSIFTIGGVRFGLEVCLDHDVKRLHKSVNGLEGSKQVEPVDVQLIPSAGMRIINVAIGTKKNGIVFNVDGVFSDDPIVLKTANVLSTDPFPADTDTITSLQHPRHSIVFKGSATAGPKIGFVKSKTGAIIKVPVAKRDDSVYIYDSISLGNP